MAQSPREPVEEAEEAGDKLATGASEDAPAEPSADLHVAVGTVIAESTAKSGPLVPKSSDIFLLARQQSFEVAQKLLESYPEQWTATDEDGHSLLHWAALVGHRGFCVAALSHGVPVDAQAENKQTPLMWAMLRGHMSVTRVLLDNKAAIQARDSLGATPLMIAVQHKSYSGMLLLMNRAGPNLRTSVVSDADKNGCSSAHWAAYKGDIVALKLLDYFQADLQVLDSAKMLPLHRAVCASQGIVVEFLIERRSDPMARTTDGKSCLDITEEKHDMAMQALLKKLMQKRSSSGGGTKVGVEDLESGQRQGEEPQKEEGIFKSLMKDKAAHKMFPVFWLICVSMALFEYIMDLRAMSYEAAPWASLLFELGVPASVAIFFLVALKDPGRVPARPQGNSGVEELMKSLDTPAADDTPPDFNRLCTTTWVRKGLRTKYCTQTLACVEDFDHYCIWLNCAIGRGNHREFVCLAVVEWLTQLTYIRLTWCMAHHLVPYQSLGSWLVGVVTGYPLLTLIVMIQSLTVPWVLMLILHQCRLVMMNLTTNEMMNMHRYEHFWVQKDLGAGRVQKFHRNPFDKGGVLANCIDFWWNRRRSEVREQPEPVVAASSCGSHGCSHDHGGGSHGGHGHSHGHGH